MNKKILLLSLISMFMISMTFGALTDNDIQFATFNDADLSGSNPIDVTGTGNSMVNNGATTGVAGLIDEAFSFDGSNDYMALSKPVDPTATANMTISLWIKTSNDCSAQECYLVTNDLASSPDFGIVIADTGLGGANKVLFGSNNLGSNVMSSSTVNDNNWHHIVATKNLANGSLWVDGVYQGSFTNAASWTTGMNWEMGAFRQLAGYYYTGLIDAYGVWDRTLTETEITDLYQSSAGLEYPFEAYSITTNLTNGTFFNSEDISIEVNTSLQSDAMFYYLNNTNYIIEDGLVAYYNFDGNYLDASSNSNDGTNSGTVLNQAELTGTITGATFDNTNSPPVGQYSMNFDGVDDYANIGNDINNKILASNEFTFSIWSNPKSFIGTTNSLFRGGSTGANSIYLYLKDTNQIIYGLWTDGTGSDETSITLPSGIALNDWALYTMVYDGSNLIFYKNGAYENQITKTGNIELDTQDFFLASRGGGSHWFNGSLDDVRIYDRALTTEEIADIYANNSLANDVRQSNANRFNFEEGTGTTTAGQPIIPLDVQQVEFDGINDYVNLGTGINVGTNNYTFLVWINLNNYDSNWESLFGGDVGSFSLGIKGTSGNIKATKVNTADAGTGALNVELNQWTLVGAILDQSNNQITYIKNNVLDTPRSLGSANSFSTNTDAIGVRKSTAVIDGYFNGSMDEVRIYDRALTTTEIELLYNESPYTRICDDCNTSQVNLYDLTNKNYNISFLTIASQTIATLEQNFNINVTYLNINSITANGRDPIGNAFYISEDPEHANVDFEMNVTYLNQTSFDKLTILYKNALTSPSWFLGAINQYQPLVNFELTDFNMSVWDYVALNVTSLTDGVSDATEEYTLYFNDELEVNNTLPSELNYYLLNVSNYVSCEDNNLTYCNITFEKEGITLDLITYTDIYNFTSSGNQTYNILAADLYGNEVNISGVILVNPYAYFEFNNSGTLLTDYTFGGTLWTNATAKFTLYNSVLTVGTNNSIEFSKVGYITQTFTQEVLNTSRINNTYNVAEAEIQVTIRDKDTLEQITVTNFTLSFIGPTGFTTTTITGNKTITGLFTAGDYELIVSGSPYTTENNFFTFTNQELLELTIFVANASTNGFVTIVATSSTGELAVGFKVQALQWDSATSQYIVVSEGTTDTSGKASLNVILNTKSYIFRLIGEGKTKDSPAETITTDENGKIVPLSLQTGVINYDKGLSNYFISSTESYNNVTNVSSIVMNYHTADGTDMVACINVYKLLNNVERLDQSFCTNESSSGVYPKNFFINSSQFTNIKTELLLGGSYYTYESYQYFPTLSFQNALLSYGLYFFVMLLLYLLSIWLGLIIFENIYIAIMLVVISGFIGFSLVPSIMTNLVATAFGLMGSLTIWAGYKKK